MLRVTTIHATAHSCQGDTVDVSLAVITAATTHRSLYVAATRGRQANHLLVVTDDGAGFDNAREVLAQALGNDRVDIPAVVQRRELARQVPQSAASPAEQEVIRARVARSQVRQRARPDLDAVARAQDELQEAQTALRQAEAEAARAPFWRRPAAKNMVTLARQDTDGTAKSYTAEAAAAPHKTALRQAEDRLDAAEHRMNVERVQERLDQRSWEKPSRTRTKSRDLGVGLEL